MKRTLLIITILVFAAGNAPAQSVPQLINYQGKLLDGDGEPLATGDYTLKFRIYDAAEGGSEVWGPQVFDGEAATGHGAQVPVVHGHFNVILGPVDEAGRGIQDAFGEPERYIEITVGAGAALVPRQQILSAPYALRALSAEGVTDGGITSSMIANDAVGSSQIAPNAVGASEIATSAVGSDELDNESILSEDIQDGAINSADLAPSAVGTREIADGSIATEDLKPLQIVHHSSVQVFSIFNAVENFQVTDGSGIGNGTPLSVTLEYTGRPIFIGVLAQWIYTDTNNTINVEIRRGETAQDPVILSSALFTGNGQPIQVPCSLTWIDLEILDPAPSTVTYTLWMRPTGTTGASSLGRVRLIAYEL